MSRFRQMKRNVLINYVGKASEKNIQRGKNAHVKIKAADQREISVKEKFDALR